MKNVNEYVGNSYLWNSRTIVTVVDRDSTNLVLSFSHVLAKSEFIQKITIDDLKELLACGYISQVIKD